MPLWQTAQQKVQYLEVTLLKQNYWHAEPVPSSLIFFSEASDQQRLGKN